MAEHQQTMSAVKRAMDIAFRVELNTNAAFKRKRARKTHESKPSLVIKTTQSRCEPVLSKVWLSGVFLYIPGVFQHHPLLLLYHRGREECV
jgi:hypothetical protein